MLSAAAPVDSPVDFTTAVGDATPTAAEINLKLAKVEPEKTPTKSATPQKEAVNKKRQKSPAEKIDDFIVGLLQKHQDQEVAQQ